MSVDQRSSRATNPIGQAHEAANEISREEAVFRFNGVSLTCRAMAYPTECRHVLSDESRFIHSRGHHYVASAVMYVIGVN